MTDKQFEKAKKIKEDILNLKALVGTLKKCVHINIHFDIYKELREPLIDTIEGQIAKLENEFKKM